ncbi:MAG: hypothetical protein ACREK2_10650, partial [Gemmatimonadota bacterium]
MRTIPPFCLLGLLALLPSCTEPAPPADAPTVPTLPFASAPLAVGVTILVSASGDTLRLSALAPEDGRQRLVRSLSGEATDSTAAVIDAATKAPLESFRLATTAQGDTVTARVEYGGGFEGQARLTLTAGQGTGVENLRTPQPALDAGQLPLTLAALPFDRADSLHFNYVAPFEKEALAARLLIGAIDTLRITGTPLAARPVLLQVSGLEERWWFAERPPHAILRVEEITRARTWTRAESPA